MEEIQSVVLETDELKSQEDTPAYASFGILSQPHFRWKQSNKI